MYSLDRLPPPSHSPVTVITVETCECTLITSLFLLEMTVHIKCTHDGCGRTFTEQRSLVRHMKGHNVEKKFSCTKCSKGFKRKDNLKQHERTCTHNHPSTWQAPVTPHIPSIDTNNPQDFKIVTTKTAFNRAVVTWKRKYKRNNLIDYVNLLDRSTAVMKDHLLRERHRQRAIKFNMSLHAVFEKAVDSSIVTDPPTVLVTDQFECM